ncbi:unnamed protein product, partial [Mesorhabditis spiculigera]
MEDEDYDKKLKRRQRNKEAAARCRQRRLELMHTLQEQVDKQKDENRKKDNQIKELKSQITDLQRFLQTHDCKMTPEQRSQIPVGIPHTSQNPKEEQTLAQLNMNNSEDLQRPDRLFELPATSTGSSSIALVTPSQGLSSTPYQPNSLFGNISFTRINSSSPCHAGARAAQPEGLINMSEVSALFAKRKDKQKKPKVVSIDAVAEVLVRHANKAEFEAFAEVEDSRPNVDAPPLRPGVDTEWIDEFEDDCGRLEGLGIKDMGAEISEKEEKEDGQTDDESSAPIVAKPATGGAYRPKVYRAPRANIDLTNQEMFPTIGAAVEMEKQHKDDKKNPWTSVEHPPASGGRYVPPNRRGDDDADFAATRRAEKEDAIAAARAMTRTPTPSAPRPGPAVDSKPSAPPAQVDAKPEKKAEATPEETKPAAAPTKPKYVPPHLR